MRAWWYLSRLGGPRQRNAPNKTQYLFVSWPRSLGNTADGECFLADVLGVRSQKAEVGSAAVGGGKPGPLPSSATPSLAAMGKLSTRAQRFRALSVPSPASGHGAQNNNNQRAPQKDTSETHGPVTKRKKQKAAKLHQI